MSRKFKTGDIVKLEGKLTDMGDGHTYPLRLDLGGGKALSFTREGKYTLASTLTLELVKAAPVEIEVGKSYTSHDGGERVVLEVFDDRVFYRYRRLLTARWDLGQRSIQSFAEACLGQT